MVPDFVDALSPDSQKLRQVTILFLDIVGSTQLSRQLDPEDIHAVVGTMLARCTGIVEAHLGRVLQYAGDSVLAVFGADETREDDPERAIHAGLACQLHLLGAHGSFAGALQFTLLGQPNPVAQGLLGHAQHPRRHRRLLPGLDQPNGLQLELQCVPRAVLVLTLLAHLSCSMNAFSASAMEYVFRAQGQSPCKGRIPA